jgi:ferredoxin
VPRLTFLPERRSLDVARGVRLIDAIRQAGLPIARPCGDVLICGRCAVRVLAGDVLPESDLEATLKRRNRIAPEQRLACALRVRDDLTIAADYWGGAT